MNAHENYEAVQCQESPIPKKKIWLNGKSFEKPQPVKVIEAYKEKRLTEDEQMWNSIESQETGLLDTAVFDSPQKRKAKEKVIESLTISKDFSYREILKPYCPAHKTANSYGFSPILLANSKFLVPKIMHSRKSSQVNSVNSIRPKLISSLGSYGSSPRPVELNVSKQLELHKNTLTGICMRNNELYTVGLDYFLNTLDSSSLQVISRQKAHNRGIVGISPYKSRIVTGDKNGKLKFWQTSCIKSIQAHEGAVKSLCSCGDLLITTADSIKIWKDALLQQEFSSSSIFYSSFANNPFTFIAGGEKELKMFDVRIRNFVCEFGDIGPFLCCAKWDDCTFWSGSEYGLIKWDMRTCGVLQKINKIQALGVCKANHLMVSVGDGVAINGEKKREGKYVSVFYDKLNERILAGDRDGNLSCVDFL